MVAGMASSMWLVKSLYMQVNNQKSVTVSVVSHGHSGLVRSLIDSLVASGGPCVSRVVITSNVPSLDDFPNVHAEGLRFDVKRTDNAQAHGFGANHNHAFEQCDTDFFCVINPDIEFTSDPFARLVETLSAGEVGLAYPWQVDEENALLDFERELVSPSAIAQRHLLGRRYQLQPHKPVHWVSGAFMVFKSSVFRELGGFDERYFMYCEDVDICLRMQLAGYRLARADAKVIHHTRRRTLKTPGHLAWHVSSLLRLWRSSSYSQYKSKFLGPRG